MQLPKLDLEPYVDMAWRRKWWILIPTLLGLAIGLVVLQVSPKIYEASTLILVEPQRIPRGYVRPTVTQDVGSRLRTISEQVNSRTNLERIIEEFKLYRKPEDRVQDLFSKIRRKINAWRYGEEEAVRLEEKSVAPENLVEKLRSQIGIEVKGRGASFTISFRWHDPNTAAQVANAIAGQFIEQNLKVREEMAMGTTAFLDLETRRLRKELETREQALEAFKKKHMGMLPDQLGSNLNILSQLKEELADLEKRISLEKQQALMIQSQSQMMAQSVPDLLGPGLDTELPTEGSGEIEELRQKLKDLLTRYTERHPDVVALKRKIAKLEKEAAEAPSGGESLPEEPLNLGGPSGQDMIAMQVQQINTRIADYEKQVESLKEQIALYKERVEKTPQVELELTKLARDYQTVQDRYAQMLAKKLDAQMAEELEKRQKGEQFKVIDSAVPPKQPVEPDARKVLALALILGLGLGGGLAYMRETLDPRFYSQQEVEAITRCKVLVSLPQMEEEEPEPSGIRRFFRKKKAA